MSEPPPTPVDEWIADPDEQIHPHLSLPHTRLSRRIDAVVCRVGEWVSWVWLLLLAVVVANVTLRYVFAAGRIELEELQWHLYAVGFLAGLSWCVETDAHVRVDFLRERLHPRMQAWVELYGILLLQLPFIVLVAVYALPFVADSFARGEISPSPGGLSQRWLVKGALLLGFGLLGLASVARLVRVAAFLFGPQALFRPQAPFGPQAPSGPQAQPRPEQRE
ncbi:MAG: TRAP transporter small permease subunit [Deltaproteobacteria bacterium]|nr:TRAP transporter small permease subunit [Deltaproteobacteria bacterium]